MFEREVKFIYDFNSNKVKKLGPSATFTELLPLGIHPSILQYISAEIEFRVFEDRQTLLKHSMFDYSGPKISVHFQKIADEIKKEKRFSTDFFSKVILHATSFNVNYLIRPNWSLKKLIFDTSDSNNVAEILQILNYAYFYKHLIKIIRNYLDKKKLITLDKEEFGELLLKFDRVSIDTYGNDILESAMKAMSSFFNIGSMKQSTVPLQGIAVFLQEKKLTEHIELIQNNIDGDIKGKMEIKDLRSILFNVPLQRTEVMDAPKESEEKKVVLETEPIESEHEEEKIEGANSQIHDEKIKEKDHEQVEITQEEKEETAKEEKDDVEIKLRENKEKEVAEVEEEREPEHEIFEDEESEEIEMKVAEDKEEVEEKKPDEVSLEDEDINDAAEYLVDQADKKSDEVILTVEDEGKYEEEYSSELEIEEEESGPETEVKEDTEFIDREDPEENPEEEVELLEKDIKELDDEQEVNLIEDVYPPTFEDYSYPVANNNENEETSEDHFEEVDELELEDDDETYEIGEEDNEHEEMIKDEYVTDEEEKIGEPVEQPVENIDDEKSIVEDDDETTQATLFGDMSDEELIDESKPEDDFIEKYGSQNHSKRIDIADLLENKNMTKIIAVVFDYDMEEFANAVEKICESETSQEAFGTLQEIFELNQVNPSSKEAQSFRDIIAEYFEQE